MKKRRAAYRAMKERQAQEKKKEEEGDIVRLAVMQAM